jgi:hypothetical protein
MLKCAKNGGNTVKKIINVLLPLAFILLALTSGCGSPNANEKGLSMSDSIIIEATNEYDGVAMEYDWLAKEGCSNNGGVKEVTLADVVYDEKNRVYDRLDVVCADGTAKNYYFNIDSFYGKFD